MDLLDMSVTTPKGNRYVLVIVDCFSRWTEACPLPNKTALAVVDAFFQLIVCQFGMPAVIHSDQGREFENNLMQELCLLCGTHKTCTTPYHPASDGLVERFNRTLPMMLAMFAGENRDDWDDILPAELAWTTRLILCAVACFLLRCSVYLLSGLRTAAVPLSCHDGCSGLWLPGSDLCTQLIYYAEVA